MTIAHTNTTTTMGMDKFTGREIRIAIFIYSGKPLSRYIESIAGLGLPNAPNQRS